MECARSAGDCSAQRETALRTRAGTRPAPSADVGAAGLPKSAVATPGGFAAAANVGGLFPAGPAPKKSRGSGAAGLDAEATSPQPAASAPASAPTLTMPPPPPQFFPAFQMPHAMPDTPTLVPAAPGGAMVSEAVSVPSMLSDAAKVSAAGPPQCPAMPAAEASASVFAQASASTDTAELAASRFTDARLALLGEMRKMKEVAVEVEK